MGLLDKFNSMFFDVDDEDMDETVAETVIPVSDYESPIIKELSKQLPENIKLVLKEMSSFDECQDIAGYLMEGRGAVINVHKMNKEQRQRTIDFLAGTVFGLKGGIQRVGKSVYLVTPQQMGVAGVIPSITGEVPAETTETHA